MANQIDDVMPFSPVEDEVGGNFVDVESGAEDVRVAVVTQNFVARVAEPVEEPVKETTQLSLVDAAQAFIDNGGNGRYRRLRKIIDDEDETRETNLTAMLYIAAKDNTFIEGDHITEGLIMETMLRREGWKNYPYTLLGIAAGQVILCFLAMMTINEPSNDSTYVMAGIYLVVTAISQEAEVTNELTSYVGKLTENYSPMMQWILFAILSPVLAVCFAFTLPFDFLVGKTIDHTYGSVVDIFVKALCIVTAISIGLRSGDPINAIQTFAGFEFISGLDEAFLSTVNYNPEQTIDIPTAEEAAHKRMVCRTLLWISIPFITGIGAYITLTNTCFIFCTPLPNVEL